MEIYEELKDFIEESSEQEKEALKIFLNSLKTKREKSNLTHIASLLQFETNQIDDKTLEMTMPNSIILDNSIGIVHGGLTATLLDTALGTLASRVPGGTHFP